MECTHDINEKNHDVKLDSKRRTMSFPPTQYGRCKKCGLLLSYVKLNGEWVIQ